MITPAFFERIGEKICIIVPMEFLFLEMTEDTEKLMPLK
jgi:hypothetical protein